MSLHVLQLGPYPPPEGGITRNMLAIRDELKTRGHRCSIIATSQSTHIVEEPDVYHPRSPVAVMRLLASLEYDVLHLHVGGDIGPRVLSLASACALFGRGKSVLTLHSGAYPLTNRAKNASPKSTRSMIFRRFSRLIAVNDAIAYVFRRSGAEAKCIRVIAPHSLRPADPNALVPLDLKTFCETHSPVLVSVGGLEKDYDPLFQVDAMKDILSEFPGAGLMIVGDGSMRGEVEQAVASSGYSDSILLAGNVDHAVTLRLMADADTVLRTTLFDGDAISVREALFLGTPVIATDNGMRPEGIHLIGMQDKTRLIKKLKLALAEGKKKSDGNDGDVSNISAVVDLYEAMAASV
jgi:glycogen(starch) synthase